MYGIAKFIEIITNLSTDYVVQQALRICDMYRIMFQISRYAPHRGIEYVSLYVHICTAWRNRICIASYSIYIYAPHGGIEYVSLHVPYMHRMAESNMYRFMFHMHRMAESGIVAPLYEMIPSHRLELCSKELIPMCVVTSVSPSA